MAAREIAVKKYVVKLSADERERLESLIHSGKHPAQKLTKARILLKADASPAGEAWSDSRIASALNTGLATIARTRRQLVEEGFEAVLERKPSPAAARPRIFDGAGEANLIALSCSEPPKGRARWTLRLLEDKVVELNIVERVSDTTIGRTLKKTFSNRTWNRNSSFRPRPARRSLPPWKMCWKSITGRMIRPVPWSAWMRPQSS